MEKYVIILLCKVGDFMSDFNSKEFGNKLRELRKSKGLSQENLATKLNISRTTIGRFENGEMIPNAQIIKELCEILGVSEGFILNGSSDTSTNYLNDEFSNLLSSTTPENQKLIYKIAKVISTDEEEEEIVKPEKDSKEEKKKRRSRKKQ